MTLALCYPDIRSRHHVIGMYKPRTCHWYSCRIYDENALFPEEPIILIHTEGIPTRQRSMCFPAFQTFWNELLPIIPCYSPQRMVHVCSLQLVAMRGQDLSHMWGLCKKGQENCDGDLAKGLTILCDWARGMWKVQEEVLKKHSIIQPQDMTEYDRSQRSCYSNAIRCKKTNTEPDWLALYPLPEALEKPADWDFQDDPADGEEDSDEDEEAGFIVTPRMAKYLSMYLRQLGDGEDILLRLPEEAKRCASIEAWGENLRECAFRIAARLEKGFRPVNNIPGLTRCIGEDYILRSLVTYVLLGHGLKVKIRDDDYGTYFPRCKYDVCLELLVKNFTYNKGVRTLFWEGYQPDEEFAPELWFKTYYDTEARLGKEAEVIRFMDHVHSDRTSLEEHGKQVLRKSQLLAKQLSPDLSRSFISSVVSHLTDVDLLKLGLCTKSN